MKGKITLAGIPVLLLLLFISFSKDSSALCNLPGGLSTTNIGVSSAKLNWATTVCDSFLVRWNVTGTTTYNYKTVSPGTLKTTTITGLYPSTSYSWVIHTYCSNGSSGGYQASPATFITLAGTVACVIPNNTTTTNVTSNTCLAAWNTNVSADSFLLRYNVAGTTNYIWKQIPGSAHSYSIPNLLPNTSYEWRVRCVCAASPAQSYSIVNSFVTLSSSCGIADVAYFTAGSITSNAATLGWRTVSGALSYNIRYGVRYSNVWTQVTSSTNSKQVSGLLPTTMYEFEVQTVCSSGASAWSLSGIFQTPAGVLALVRGPYLNLSTTNAIYVRWRTNNASDSKVKYGTTATNLNLSVTDAASTTEHTIHLTGLATNTKYYYSVGSAATTLQGDTGNYFTTNPVVGSTGAVRVWVIGDFGINSTAQNQVRDAYNNYAGAANTNVWLWVGDNAYNDGTDAEYTTSVFGKYPYQMKHTVIWPATGNHDLHTSNATAQTGPYFDAFVLPKQAEAGGVASGTEAYYSFNYANIHFICLESTDATFRAAGGAMVNWLTSDLSANTQRWTVVYFHHPPYSKGSHDSDTEPELLEMRNIVAPILENYKVDLVLSGHSHSYERSMMIKGHFGVETSFNPATMAVNSGSGTYPASYLKTSPAFNGTVYVVCGVSGQTGSTAAGWPHNAMYTSSTSVFGSLVIDVAGDRLDCKLLTSTSTIFDQFTIQKSGVIAQNKLSADNGTLSSDELAVFPNPVTNEMTVRYFLDKAAETHIEITDVTGRIVYSLDNGSQDSGDHEIKLTKDEAVLPSGIYLLKLFHGDGSSSVKVVVE